MLCIQGRTFPDHCVGPNELVYLSEHVVGLLGHLRIEVLNMLVDVGLLRDDASCEVRLDDSIITDTSQLRYDPSSYLLVLNFNWRLASIKIEVYF